MQFLLISIPINSFEIEFFKAKFKAISTVTCKILKLFIYAANVYLLACGPFKACFSFSLKEYLGGPNYALSDLWKITCFQRVYELIFESWIWLFYFQRISSEILVLWKNLQSSSHTLKFRLYCNFLRNAYRKEADSTLGLDIRMIIRNIRAKLEVLNFQLIKTSQICF